MKEVSEKEWEDHKSRVADLQRQAAGMSKAVEGLPHTSTQDLKKAAEECIGPFCDKIIESVEGLGKQVDHLDEVIHSTQRKPPARGHEQHQTWPEAADCPTCGPKMKAAIETKFKDELHPKPKPYESPFAPEIKAEFSKILDRQKVPHCTNCLAPAEIEGEKPKTEDCPTCGIKY